VPRTARPGDRAVESAQDQVQDAVVGQIRDEIIDQVVEQVATRVATRICVRLLGEMVAVIGAIDTCITIFTQIYELANPGLYSRARGMGAAVQANRIAEYAFQQRTPVMGAARSHIQGLLGMSDENAQHEGEVKQDVIDEMADDWEEIRQSIDEERNRGSSGGEGEGDGQEFADEGALADYLVRTSINAVDIAYYRDLYHQSYRASHRFSLREQNRGQNGGGQGNAGGQNGQGRR
jgi:hypothetical protein